MANHLKGSKLFPAPYTMGAVPDGFKAWYNNRSAVPGPFLDGGQMTTVDYLAMWDAWVLAFTAPKLGLYKAPTIQLPATAAFAALTEPVGSWYTAAGVVAVLTGPWVNGDGSVEIGTNSHTFVYSGVSAAEVVYGSFLNDVF